mmetsp:Transcript_75199/g.244532  ORF Transcript_75199/g.244532 Transcript_75199/m.244532 type:complete len:92 (-) Transcript_75199:254-529(-)
MLSRRSPAAGDVRGFTASTRLWCAVFQGSSIPVSENLGGQDTPFAHGLGDRGSSPIDLFIRAGLPSVSELNKGTAFRLMEKRVGRSSFVVA